MTDIRMFAIPAEPADVRAVRDDQGDLWVRLDQPAIEHRTGNAEGRDWLGRAPRPGAHWFRVGTQAEMREAYGEDVAPDDPDHQRHIIGGSGQTWLDVLLVGGELRDATGEDAFVIVDR